MNCPLCETECPDAPVCWSCGYDFERRDARAAIRRARSQLHRANAMWIGGLALVFLAPALVFQTAIIVGLVGGAVVASGGIVLATFGIMNGDRAKKQLVQLQRRSALPPARIV